MDFACQADKSVLIDLSLPLLLKVDFSEGFAVFELGTYNHRVTCRMQCPLRSRHSFQVFLGATLLTIDDIIVNCLSTFTCIWKSSSRTIGVLVA